MLSRSHQTYFRQPSKEQGSAYQSHEHGRPPEVLLRYLSCQEIMKKHKRSGSGQGKAKKSKAGAEYDIDEALSLKRSIESGQLSHQQLLQIVGAQHEPCELYNKSCKGRKDSPNCLCGLIPNPGGFRRKGLWQKEPEAIASLGIDPAEYKREVLTACKMSWLTISPSGQKLHDGVCVWGWCIDTKWVGVWLRNAGLCLLSASIADSLMYGRM